MALAEDAAGEKVESRFVPTGSEPEASGTGGISLFNPCSSFCKDEIPTLTPFETPPLLVRHEAELTLGGVGVIGL